MTAHPDGEFVEAARPAPSPALVEQRRQARLDEERQVDEAAQRRRKQEVQAWKGRMRRGRRRKRALQTLSRRNKRAMELRWARERLEARTAELFDRAAAKAGELEDRRSAVFLDSVRGSRPPNDVAAWQFFAAVRPDAPAVADDRLPFPTGNSRVS